MDVQPRDYRRQAVVDDLGHVVPFLGVDFEHRVGLLLYGAVGSGGDVAGGLQVRIDLIQGLTAIGGQAALIM